MKQQRKFYIALDEIQSILDKLKRYLKIRCEISSNGNKIEANITMCPIDVVFCEYNFNIKFDNYDFKDVSDEDLIKIMVIEQFRTKLDRAFIRLIVL